MKAETPYQYRRMSDALMKSFIDSACVYSTEISSEKPELRFFQRPDYRAFYKRIDVHNSDEREVVSNTESSNTYLDEIEYN